MTEFPEVTLVAVEPGAHALKATALRLNGGPWHVFLSAYGQDRWLAFMEVASPMALDFDDDSAAFFAKASLLLGESWDECFANTEQVVTWQHYVLEHLGPGMRHRIDSSMPREVLGWREEMATVEPGEFLRARLTGDEPLAVRN